MTLDSSPTTVLSPSAQALTASSPRLCRLIYPDDPTQSPYDVLDYDAYLTLHEPTGKLATFERRQWLRFSQNGVAAILDHVWGDGSPVASYHNSAGKLIDRIEDGKRQHLVVVLQQQAAVGDVMQVTVRREALDAFTGAEEWLETTVDHPVKRLKARVNFPKGRPCLRGCLKVGEWEFDLPVYALPGGRTSIFFDAEKATPNTPFLVRWWW